MNSLISMSMVDLLHEILRDGRAGLTQDEPFSISSLIGEIEGRTGQQFGGDVDGWLGWLTSNSSFSEQDAYAIRTIQRLVAAEQRFREKTDH